MVDISMGFFRQHLLVVVCGLVLVFLIVTASGRVSAETKDVTVTVIIVQCNDGVDNDFDSLIDFPNDPGCIDASDDDETDPQCIDGLDNDSDGLIDFPADPGCTDANDNDETDTPVPTPTSTGTISGGRVSRLLEQVASRVVFVGLAHPGGEVVLLQDGVLVAKVNADEDASFSITRRNVTPGRYLFTVYGVDTNDLRSGILSFTVNIVTSFRTDITDIFVPPTIRLLDESVSEVTRISGQTAPNANVTVVGFAGGEEVTRIAITSNDSGRYIGTLTSSALGIEDVAIKSFAAVAALASPFGRAASFVPDSSEVLPIRGDLNGDRRVSLVDFSMIAFWFRRSSPPSQFDLDGNGVVDLVDLSIMVFNWTG